MRPIVISVDHYNSCLSFHTFASGWFTSSHSQSRAVYCCWTQTWTRAKYRQARERKGSTKGYRSASSFNGSTPRGIVFVGILFISSKKINHRLLWTFCFLIHTISSVAFNVRDLHLANLKQAISNSQLVTRNSHLATRNSWLANLELAWLMKPSRQLSILSGEGSEPRENPRANGKGARGCDRLGDSFRVQRACLLSYYPNGELARTLDQFYHINVRITKHSVRKNGSKVVIYNCMVRFLNIGNKSFFLLMWNWIFVSVVFLRPWLESYWLSITR